MKGSATRTRLSAPGDNADDLEAVAVGQEAGFELRRGDGLTVEFDHHGARRKAELAEEGFQAAGRVEIGRGSVGDDGGHGPDATSADGPGKPATFCRTPR